MIGALAARRPTGAAKGVPMGTLAAPAARRASGPAWIGTGHTLAAVAPPPAARRQQRLRLRHHPRDLRRPPSRPGLQPRLPLRPLGLAQPPPRPPAARMLFLPGLRLHLQSALLLPGKPTLLQRQAGQPRLLQRSGLQQGGHLTEQLLPEQQGQPPQLRPRPRLAAHQAQAALPLQLPRPPQHKQSKSRPPPHPWRHPLLPEQQGKLPLLLPLPCLAAQRAEQAPPPPQPARAPQPRHSLPRPLQRLSLRELRLFPSHRALPWRPTTSCSVPHQRRRRLQRPALLRQRQPRRLERPRLRRRRRPMGDGSPCTAAPHRCP